MYFRLRVDGNQWNMKEISFHWDSCAGPDNTVSVNGKQTLDISKQQNGIGEEINLRNYICVFSMYPFLYFPLEWLRNQLLSTRGSIETMVNRHKWWKTIMVKEITISFKSMGLCVRVIVCVCRISHESIKAHRNFNQITTWPPLMHLPRLNLWWRKHNFDIKTGNFSLSDIIRTQRCYKLR